MAGNSFQAHFNSQGASAIPPPNLVELDSVPLSQAASDRRVSEPERQSLSAQVPFVPPTFNPNLGTSVPTHPCPPPPANEPPITKNWEIPPRPKPGRKPAKDTPVTKRKQQNRDAQRAFRERKARKVGDLEQEITALQIKHERKLSHCRAEFNQKEHAAQQMLAWWQGQATMWKTQAERETYLREQSEQEVQRLRKQFDDMTFKRWNSSSDSSLPSSKSSWDQISPTTRDLPSLSYAVSRPLSDAMKLPEPQVFTECRDCGQDGRCACIEKVLQELPDSNLEDANAEQEPHDNAKEIDFTSFGKNFRTTSDVPVVRHDGKETSGVNQQSRVVDPMKDNHNNHPTLVSPPDSATVEWPPQMNLLNKPQPVQPSCTPKGPGTCPSCLDDPEKRRWCQSAARSMDPPAPRNSSVATLMSQGGLRPNLAFSNMVSESSHDTTMSCSDIYDVINKDPQLRTNKDNPSVLQKLKPQPPNPSTACNSCNAIGCSAFEVDCASVLTLMSTSGKRFSNHSSPVKSSENRQLSVSDKNRHGSGDSRP